MNETSAALEVITLRECVYPCSDRATISQKYFGTSYFRIDLRITLKVMKEK